MSWADECEPRDRVAAARSAAVLILVAALVALGYAAALDPTIVSQWRRAMVVATTVVLVPLAVLLSRRGHRVRASSWFWIPVAGIAIITILDLVNGFASAAGQVFLAFPVLFAGSQLRRRPAIVVTVLAIAADAVVALTFLPVGRALTDVAYVGATFAVMTALLVQAGERSDALVARLTALAAIDPLTGLATRRVLDEAAREHLGDTGEGTALVILDLDGFKAINDSRGHPVGDDVLVHFAALLRTRARSGMVLSRLGGDELAVLAPRCSRAAAARFAEEVVALVCGLPLETAGGDVPLSVSAGVAHAPPGPTTLRELYSAADAALYRAKTGGRGRVAVGGVTVTGNAPPAPG